MRRCFAMLAAPALAACITVSAPIDEPATPDLIERAAALGTAGFTLASGEYVELHRPRDFGSALCSEHRCVRKSDIVTVRGYADPRVDVGSTARTIALAPIVVPLAVTVLMIGRDPESPQERPVRTAEQELPVAAAERKPPVAAAEQERPVTAAAQERRWLDARGLGGHDRGRNMCVHPQSPARIEQTFARDADAADWIYDHRHEIAGACLIDLTEEYLRFVDRERAIELWALGHVRIRWENLRCTSPWRHWPWELTPPEWSDLGERRGDPEVIRRIQEAFDDPRTFDYAVNLAALCGPRSTVRAMEDWPAIRAEVMRGRPLS